MLTVKNITRQLPEYAKIFDIYKNSFPEEEQMPVWLLRLFARRKRVEFLAFYDQGVFCGFTYLVHSEKLTFIFYLATDPDQRSQGYGSKILSWIQEKYQDRGVVLTIETVDPAAENYQQRLRRQQFYFKNNFHDTGHKVKEYGVLYDVLANTPNFVFSDYQALLKYFSFGFYSVKPEKMEDK
ncbi:GNAT family N-acetyltransferase [Enterococcus sp. 669A]|uniref:GNAT family N-acetyltransferase n=1 Tax=Candidatus Enterococcus moelleringii TaxID=2815325 RepID=A0ABS3LEB4_9ENTE|nr:GNAT family N-acetyltransferase [Enterococcus sp. 669A]MBO1307972.1 GNAT family N-acetyltransferase [Enterococcus sp. 669A]